MKKLITIVPIVLIGIVLGCSKAPTNQQITSTIAIGVGLAFKYVPMDAAKRTVIANYVSGIAGGARALTGNETNEQVAAALTAKVPQSVLSQYPEIGTIVIPQVVSYYENAKAQLGAGTQAFVERMNAIATGLEQAAAAYIGH